MPALATPYKRKPTYQFPDLNTTGLEEIPADRILYVESNNATFVKLALDPADLTIQNGLDSGNVIPARLYDKDTGLTLDPGDLVKVSGDTMTGDLTLPNLIAQGANITQAAIGTGDITQANITTADIDQATILTADINTSNTGTANTSTSNITTANIDNAIMGVATVQSIAAADTDVVNAQSYAQETLGGTVKMRLDLTDPNKPKLYMSTTSTNP